jgi:hypothetical protein
VPPCRLPASYVRDDEWGRGLGRWRRDEDYPAGTFPSRGRRNPVGSQHAKAQLVCAARVVAVIRRAGVTTARAIMHAAALDIDPRCGTGVDWHPSGEAAPSSTQTLETVQHHLKPIRQPPGPQGAQAADARQLSLGS